jgi:hypothetical protein
LEIGDFLRESPSGDGSQFAARYRDERSGYVIGLVRTCRDAGPVYL